MRHLEANRHHIGGYTTKSASISAGSHFASLSNLQRVFTLAVLLACISFFWLLHLFYSAQTDIARDEIPRITFYVALFLSLEIGLLVISSPFAMIVMPSLAVLNTYSLFF